MDLVGFHPRSLDEKGRLVLPAIFRADFSEHAFLSPAGPFVAMHTEAGYHEMIEHSDATSSGRSAVLPNLCELMPRGGLACPRASERRPPSAARSWYVESSTTSKSGTPPIGTRTPKSP